MTAIQIRIPDNHEALATAPELQALLTSPAEIRARAHLQAQWDAASEAAPSIAIAGRWLDFIRLNFTIENWERGKLVDAIRVGPSPQLNSVGESFESEDPSDGDQSEDALRKAVYDQFMQLACTELILDFELPEISPPQPAPYNLPPQARATLAKLSADEGRRLLDLVRELAYNDFQYFQQMAQQDGPLLEYLETRAVELVVQIDEKIAEVVAAIAASAASRPFESGNGHGRANDSPGSDAEPSRPRLCASGLTGADTDRWSPSTSEPSSSSASESTVVHVHDSHENVAPTSWEPLALPYFESLLRACECLLERDLVTQLTN